MNKAAILKLTGIVIGLFVLTTVIIFFLYPYLNEEGYQEAIESVQASEEQVPAQANEIPEGDLPDMSGSTEQRMDLPSMQDADITSVADEISAINGIRDTCISDMEEQLLATIDSLKQANRTFQSRLADLNEELRLAREAAAPEPLASAQAGDEMLTADAQLSSEEFFEKTKSLLNLDEEELAPIVAELSTEDIVRLYNGGGTIQREKLLRSLEPERAAAIMKEIML